MNATISLLDKFRATCLLPSDNQAAIALGVTRGCVSNWRRNVSHAEPEHVATMAKACGLDPEEWVLRVQADREVSPERKKVWLRCAERIATCAVACIAIYAATRPQHGPALAALVAFVHKPTAIDILHFSAAVTAAAATVAYLAAWSNRNGTSALR